MRFTKSFRFHKKRFLKHTQKKNSLQFQNQLAYDNNRFLNV